MMWQISEPSLMKTVFFAWNKLLQVFLGKHKLSRVHASSHSFIWSSPGKWSITHPLHFGHLLALQPTASWKLHVHDLCPKDLFIKLHLFISSQASLYPKYFLSDCILIFNLPYFIFFHSSLLRKEGYHSIFQWWMTHSLHENI